MLALTTRSSRPVECWADLGPHESASLSPASIRKASRGSQLPYTGHMSPHAVITDAVFEALLQCEMKAYLLLEGATGTDPEIADWQRTLAHRFQKSCSERLRLAAPE